MNSKELLEFAESLGIQYKLLEDDYYFYLPDGMVDGDFDNHTDDDEDKQPVFFVWRHLTKEVVLTLHISVDEEFNILYNDSYISESMDEVKKNVIRLYAIVKVLNDSRKNFKENANLFSMKGDFS